jgi:cytidylate kinase
MVIVTIDGPAGAGKSTVAKLLARELNFQYLDTGAMYRALVFSAIQRKIDFSDPESLVKNSHSVNLRLESEKVIIDGVDVSTEIRLPEIAKYIRFVADNELIREHLVNMQRQIAAHDNFVCEGRDQGTVAFPDSQCKIFLTASSTERAIRRQRDLANKGIVMEVDEIKKDQDERDQQDYNRKVGKLIKADDAIEVITDGLSLQEVVETLTRLVNQKSSANNF